MVVDSFPYEMWKPVMVKWLGDNQTTEFGIIGEGWREFRYETPNVPVSESPTASEIKKRRQLQMPSFFCV
jgi:hypothetical protein